MILTPIWNLITSLSESSITNSKRLSTTRRHELFPRVPGYHYQESRNTMICRLGLLGGGRGKTGTAPRRCVTFIGCGGSNNAHLSIMILQQTMWKFHFITGPSQLTRPISYIAIIAHAYTCIDPFRFLKSVISTLPTEKYPRGNNLTYNTSFCIT